MGKGFVLISNLKRFLAARAAAAIRPILGSRGREAFGILMYHRIVPRPGGVPKPTFNVTPHRFRAQMEGLLSLDFEAWPLRNVLEFRRKGLPIPRTAFVVTIDDGYENVYHHAWPVLRRLGIPATIFIATAYLDRKIPFPFDDWSAAGSDDVPHESWRPLTSGHCAEMLESGLVDLGAHTHSHEDFRGRPEALRVDLLRSLDVLRSRFGLQDATFAFPYGTRHLGFSGPVPAAIARETGVLCALTSEAELVTPRIDPFDWGRFAVDNADTAGTLAARLTGWYGLIRDVSRWSTFRDPALREKRWSEFGFPRPYARPCDAHRNRQRASDSLH